MKFFDEFVFVLACLGPGCCFSQPSPALKHSEGLVGVINMDKDVRDAIGKAHYSDEEWSGVFPIFTQRAYEKGIRQPIQGHYVLEGTDLWFRPIFPFAEGETYKASLGYDVLRQKLGESLAGNVTDDEGTIELTFTIPGHNVPRTYIESVFPASDTLPENLLRMYIYFSAAMSAGEAYQHIKLRDKNGMVIDKPFLIVDQELWDASRQRFTLLFDPGRIKRGIKSNLDMGQPLQAHNTYYLSIDSLWRDVYGNGLSGNYQRRISIKAPERSTLNTNHWNIIEPEPGTTNPFVVEFDRPLDHAQCLKYISISHTQDGMVKGVASLKQDDTTWAFTPARPWTNGTYALLISPDLEDPAGNTFNNPYDVDLSVSTRKNSAAPIRITFELK